MGDQNRVIFKSKGSIAITMIGALVLAVLGYAALSVLSASINLGDFWSIGLIAVAVLGVIVWLAIKLLYRQFGPFLIITPDEIRCPKAFKTRIYDVTPTRRVGQYERVVTFQSRHTATGDFDRGGRTVASVIVTTDADGTLVQLASGAPDNPQLSEIVAALAEIARISVEPLQMIPANPAAGTPARPDVSHWS